MRLSENQYPTRTQSQRAVVWCETVLQESVNSFREQTAESIVRVGCSGFDRYIDGGVLAPFKASFVRRG